MGKLLVSQKLNASQTMVSNAFIDLFMPYCNELQLKVYLHVLKSAQAGEDTGIAEIADFCNDSEREVLRALRYWERLNVLGLDYAGGEIPVGVRVNPIPEATQPMAGKLSRFSEGDGASDAAQELSAAGSRPAERIAPELSAAGFMPPEYSAKELPSADLRPLERPVAALSAAGFKPLERSAEELPPAADLRPPECPAQELSAAGSRPAKHIADCTAPESASSGLVPQTAALPAGSPAALPAIEYAGSTRISIPALPEPTAEFAKREYTPEQLSSFEEDKKFSQLLFVAEQYQGRPLMHRDVETLLFLYDVCRLSQELIYFLIEYCMDRGKKDFRYIEAVGLSWAKNGITTKEEALQFSGKYDKLYYEVMRALGRNTEPVKTEADYITRWAKTWGFPRELILEACRKTVLAADSHRFEYCDKILSAWNEKGIRNMAELEQSEKKWREKKDSPSPRRGSAAGAFGRYPQTTYDFNILEKLISNH